MNIQKQLKSHKYAAQEYKGRGAQKYSFHFIQYILA